MRHFLLKIVFLSALIASVFWFARAPDWPSATAALGALGALLKLEKDDWDATDNPDRELFRNFMGSLPYEGPIQFLDSGVLEGGSFDFSSFSSLFDFAQRWNDAAHEFLDPALESGKERLRTAAVELTDALCEHTFPKEGNPNNNEIPPEWECKEPARWEQATGELRDLGNRVVAAHQDFVRAARRKLRM